MFYTEQTEQTCKMRRFRGIYVLYVNKSAKKTYFFLFGYWRPRVRVPPLRPKNSRKRAIFDLFSAVFILFCTKMAFWGRPHVCPNFEPLDCFFIAIFPLLQKIAYLCLLRRNFWRLTVVFRQPSFVLFSFTNWNLIVTLFYRVWSTSVPTLQVLQFARRFFHRQIFQE